MKCCERYNPTTYFQANLLATTRLDESDKDAKQKAKKHSIVRVPHSILSQTCPCLFFLFRNVSGAYLVEETVTGGGMWCKVAATQVKRSLSFAA